MSLVIEIQTKLKSLGLYKGNLDGISGPLTEKAVKEGIAKGIRTEKDLYDCQNPLITTNFRYSELIHSNTAIRLGIKNIPNAKHKANLIESCTKLWQPARDILGKTMIITSGYRSPLLNSKVGGSDSSAHSVGCAIDFTSPSFGSSRAIANKLAKEFKAKGIKFDQIILEFPDSDNSWVHLGYKNRKNEQNCQLLTAVKRNGKTVYLPGLI